jgi:hypothetical protein
MADTPTDNIQEPQSTEPAHESTPRPESKQTELEQPQQLAVELYTLSQAIDKVSQHYEIPFKKVSFKFPYFITHGAIVEFIDGTTNATLAKFSLYMLNALSVDEKTSQLSMPVLLTGMLVGDALKPRTLDINLQAKST